MKIIIDKAIENGYLKDKYGKYASEENKINGIPYVSFPFEVKDVNSKYKYLSWVFIDHDSNPVVSFSWIHWLVANYKIDNSYEIEENLLQSKKRFVGGQNSYASPLGNISDENIIYNYGGPMPPNCDHNYTLIVYAYEKELKLEDGYFYNEFLKVVSKQDYEKIEVNILSRV